MSDCISWGSASSWCRFARQSDGVHITAHLQRAFHLATRWLHGVFKGRRSGEHVGEFSQYQDVEWPSVVPGDGWAGAIRSGLVIMISASSGSPAGLFDPGGIETGLYELLKKKKKKKKHLANAKEQNLNPNQDLLCLFLHKFLLITPTLFIRLNKKTYTWGLPMHHHFNCEAKIL